jgi:hypothetical protein
MELRHLRYFVGGGVEFHEGGDTPARCPTGCEPASVGLGR